MDVKISPNFEHAKLDSGSIEDLIDVFEDRVRHWLLEPTKSLLKTQHGDIAALCLILTYFEGITIYLKGKDSQNNSKVFFREGFLEVMKVSGIDDVLLGRVADVIYSDARCGFVHDGCFRSKIFVSPDASHDILITLPKKNGIVDRHGNIQSIIINPNRVLSAVENHFENVLQSLRNKAESEARSNFLTACKIKWTLDEPPVIIGLDPSHIKSPYAWGQMKQSHNRFVAHFDMLGMKQTVLRNVDEAWGALSDINEARKRIYEISFEIKDRNQFVADRVRTFFFSDTVVIFTMSDEPEDLYAILILSSELFSNSLHRRVPLRGGIAYGEFFFNLEESLFLGIPLVKAYKIGECAQWIGIVVDQIVAEKAKLYPIGEEIIQWDVPQKDNSIKREFVLNWPWIFRKNFTVKPVTIDAFYEAFKPLFGSYHDLRESDKIKYKNTVTFINSILNNLQ